MARAKGKRVTMPDGTVHVAAKAPNGEGSIYAVAEGGYKATYVDPHTGKRRTVSGRTKTEAAARRDARLAELGRATPSGRLGEHPSIASVAAWWLDNVAAVNVRPTTLHAYRKDVERLSGVIGGQPVADLDVEVVRSLLAQLRRAGHKPGTIRNTRTRLRQVAEAAIELGYLTTNPVISVPTPKATAEDRRAKRVLTPDEIHRLLRALNPENRYDAAICLLYTSGIRVSEALGLAWSDLDLDAGTATLRRGCTYEGGGVGSRLEDLKTTATHGIHHLSPTAVAMLRARRRAQAAERLAAGDDWPTITYEGRPIELVFTTPKGQLAKRQNVQQALNNACDRAGLDTAGIGTHTGRRSTITALFIDGASIDDIARHVGHASTDTTAGYVQDLGTRPAEVAKHAARLLDPAAR